MDHENVIKYIDQFETEKHKFIVMEYLPLTLGKLIEEYDISDSVGKEIFLKIVKDLRYCHTNRNIIHRDLKLENIMLRVDHFAGSISDLKIVDFGLSCSNQSSLCSRLNFCGSL